jgi:hypothetical protein
MPLQIPNLDDRTYGDLVEEARRLIISYDPEWTNHNPSDPGVTLIELFAYLTEIVLYRMNRVTGANQGKFLKLLAPGSIPSDEPAVLAEQVRAAVLRARGRFRAVTVADFESLALEDFNEQRAAGVPAIRRARCVPGRNLQRSSELDRGRRAPGHVSLVIVPERPPPMSSGVPQPPQALVDALFEFLDERRTLTTRLHVVGPTVTPVSAEIVIARTSDAFDADVKQRVVDKLAAFFDPLGVLDGPSPGGWPFGRDVFVSEVLEQIEAVQGVDYITEIMLASACGGADPRCVPGVPLFHAQGDQIGLGLAEDRLPLTSIDPSQIVIASSSSFVLVQLTLSIANPTADLASIKKQVKAIVRTNFHPLHAGPKPNATSTVDLMRVDLDVAFEAVPADVTILALVVDPPHRLPVGATVQTTTGVRVGIPPHGPGEVINWRVKFLEA